MQYLCTSSKYYWNANSKKLISCFCYIKYDDGQYDRFCMYNSMYNDTSCKHDERFYICKVHTVQYLRLQYYSMASSFITFPEAKLYDTIINCAYLNLNEKHWELKRNEIILIFSSFSIQIIFLNLLSMQVLLMCVYVYYMVNCVD